MSRRIKLSASSVAKLLDQSCMRRMVFDTFNTDYLISQGIKENKDIDPTYPQTLVNMLLFREGDKFEHDIYQGLEEDSGQTSNLQDIEIVAEKPSKGHPKYAHVKANQLLPFILNPPEKDYLFFQVEIPITQSFVRKYITEIDSSLLSKNIAILDLLYYDARQKTWFIIDIKKSEVISNSHRYQVAFYWMVMDAWACYELGEDITISTTGYIRLKGSESEDFLGEPFDIIPFRGRLSDALANTFPTSLSLGLDHPNWHLIYSCVKCSYYLHCKNDSVENHYLSEVPYLTRTAKQFLNDNDVITLEEAEQKFTSDSKFGSYSSTIKREREQILMRIQTKIQYLNDPESYPWKFIRKPVFDMPNPFFIEYPIFISSEKEYVHGYVYQISILYRDRGEKKLAITKSLYSSITDLNSNINVNRSESRPENNNNHFISFIMEEPVPEEQIRILKEALHIINELLTEISELSEEFPNHKRTAHFFFLDKIDIKNIYSTSLKYSVEDSALQYELERLLSFFPPTQEYIDEQGDPDQIWNVPYTILSQVIRKCLILPVESTAWKIQEIWRDKNTKEPLLKVRRPNKRYLQDISNQHTLLFAHDYWRQSRFLNKNSKDGKRNLDTIVRYKVKISQAIYWNLARLNGFDEKSIFTLFKAPIAKPREIVGPSTNFERLAEELLQNMPDDSFLRPLNYFLSCEVLNESITYYKNLCSDLQERLTHGVTLGGLKIIDAYVPTGTRKKGFYAKFKIYGLNTSKIQLKPGTFILSDEVTANNLYSLKSKERNNLVSIITKVESLNTSIMITARILGTRSNVIKNPFFRDVELTRQIVTLKDHHRETTYYLDEIANTTTSWMIKNFLTSFAYLRLSRQFPAYLESFLVSSSFTDLRLKNPAETISEGLLEWDSFDGLESASNLNQKQKEAVNSVLIQNKISLVWGPPGTGKTRVVAWSIIIGLFNTYSELDHRMEIKKIAVTAFTNRAIDNAKDKFLQAVMEYYNQPLVRDLEEIFVIRAHSKSHYTIYTVTSDSQTFVETDKFEYYEQLVKDDYSTVIVFGTVFQINHLSDDEPVLTDTYTQIHGRYGQYFKQPTQIFDLLVVDEASQLKVTEFFMSAFTSTEQGIFLIVGDDKQLSPVITGDYPEAFTSKVGSIYTYFKDLWPELNPIMLNQTYRFSSRIANFPSNAYYEGELFSRKAHQRFELDKLAEQSYLYELLNSEKEIVLFTYKGHTRAPDNEYEAEIVGKIVAFYSKYLLRNDYYLQDDQFQRELGIITPHNAQVNAINNAILNEGIPLGRIPLIDTVDKYQGQERSIIVISYGVSDSDFAEQEISFILSPNRFNVSVTRPEKKYIVILSEALISMIPEEEEYIKYAFLFEDYKNSFDNRKDFTFKLLSGDFEGKVYY